MGYFWENWPCYNGTVLHMIATWLWYRCHWGRTLGNTWHSFICLLWWHIMNLALTAAPYQEHVWQGQVKGEVGTSDAWTYMPWKYWPWLNIIVYCCGTHTLHLFCFSLTHWGWDKMAAILQMTFSIAFSWIKMYGFLFKFPKGPNNNNISALVRIMARCRPGDKPPFSEAMMVRYPSM